MLSGRPWNGAQNRRLFLAVTILLLAGANPPVQGDDSPAEDSARVEVNGVRRSEAAKVKVDLGDNKNFDRRRVRRRSVVNIDLGESKDATVEIVREQHADVEINGYRVK